MSATATFVEAPRTVQAASGACQNCGVDLPTHLRMQDEDSQRRILELESQVKILSSKAAAAADKLADYEDEIRFLRQKMQNNQMQPPPTPGLPPSSSSEAFASPPQEPQQQQQQQQHQPPQPPPTTRLSSLSALFPRRASPSSSGPPTPGLPPTSFGDNPTELATALTHERRLRQQAESSLNQTQSEVEELTAQLFSQANEMVATERKERRRLEERVEVLEQRDGEKRRRLDWLEKAVERVDRVRGLIGP